MTSPLRNCMTAGFASALDLAPNVTPFVISQICFLWVTTLASYCLAKKMTTPANPVLAPAYLNGRPSYLTVRNNSNTSVKNGLLISVTTTLALSILLFYEGVRNGCRFP